MTIVSEHANIKWNTKTKKYYEDLGYQYTGINTELTVKIEHLTSGSPSYVQVKCDNCGKTYETEYRKIINHRKSHPQKDYCTTCKYVERNNRAKTHEQFCDRVKEMYKDEYTILGEYKNSNTKILVRHNCNDCDNYEWFVRPNDFLKNHKCPICAELNRGYALRKSHEQFQTDVYNLVKDEYSVLGIYKNSSTKIKMKHNICNHEWSVVPDAFLRGSRCPLCSESKGEKKIREWLIDNGFNFKQEYKISECKDKYVLRFDFAIFIKDNIKLIEYDGQGHFCDKVFSEKSYKTTIHHDFIKNEFCSKNNIYLLRIPYWDFNNIENILHKNLCS